METKKVWISTIPHIKKFNKIMKETSILKRVLGKYKMPEQFPRLEFLFFQFPVIFINQGELEIKEDKLEFESIVAKRFTNCRKVNFKLGYNNIKSIELYQYPDILDSAYDLKWIRIKTDEKLYDGDFLISLAGMGNELRELRTESELLYRRIRQTMV